MHTQLTATSDPAALLRGVADGTDREARELLHRSRLPAEVLHAIVVRFAGDTATLALVAKRDDCPADLLCDLARHPHGNVRMFAATNPTLPDAAAWGLADDPDPGIRGMLPTNPAVPWPVAVLLTFDESPVVRRHAAGLSNMPRYMSDWNRWKTMLHWAAAENTPVQVFARLAEAEQDDVRQAVADNPAAPDDVRAWAALTSGKSAPSGPR